MMRKLFLSSTLLFWLAVAGFWAASTWLPGTAAGVATAGDRTYDLAEVARHARPDDCWLAIDAQVYDLSTYVPQHPADPSVLAPWCGREASQAYHTKMKGRPHSPYANQLLPRYRIGAVRKTP